MPHGAISAKGHIHVQPASLAASLPGNLRLGQQTNWHLPMPGVVVAARHAAWPGRRGILFTVAALALTAVAAIPAEAQRLAGHVFDAATGEPIPTALVQLIAADSTVLARTATDARGRFEFVLQGDAQFLRATRLGYGEVREPLNALRADGPALIVRLPPRAIPVPEVVVEAERRNRYLDGVGFYNRRRLGHGEFIGRDVIERNHANARSAGDILATLRGLMVRAGQDTAGGDVARVDVAEAGRLEVYAGRDRVRGGLTGISVALPAGIVGGMICAKRCARTERGARVIAPAQGALAGTAVGAGLGFILAPERWRLVLMR
jgi:hypothetical protein